MYVCKNKLSNSTTIMGFGGLEITPKGITQIKSKLPAAWKSLTMTGVGVERKTWVVNF